MSNPELQSSGQSDEYKLGSYAWNNRGPERMIAQWKDAELEAKLVDLRSRMASITDSKIFANMQAVERLLVERIADKSSGMPDYKN